MLNREHNIILFALTFRLCQKQNNKTKHFNPFVILHNIKELIVNISRDFIRELQLYINHFLLICMHIHTFYTRKIQTIIVFSLSKYFASYYNAWACLYFLMIFQYIKKIAHNKMAG